MEKLRVDGCSLVRSDEGKETKKLGESQLGQHSKGALLKQMKERTGRQSSQGKDVCVHVCVHVRMCACMQMSQREGGPPSTGPSLACSPCGQSLDLQLLLNQPICLYSPRGLFCTLYGLSWKNKLCSPPSFPWPSYNWILKCAVHDFIPEEH